MTSVGVHGDKPKLLRRAVVSLSASGVVVPAVSGFHIKVYAYSFQSRDDGMTVQFKDGSGGINLDQVWSFNQREGTISPACVPDTYFFATDLSNALYAQISGTGTIDIAVSYWSMDNF